MREDKQKDSKMNVYNINWLSPFITAKAQRCIQFKGNIHRQYLTTFVLIRTFSRQVRFLESFMSAASLIAFHEAVDIETIKKNSLTNCWACSPPVLWMLILWIPAVYLPTHTHINRRKHALQWRILCQQYPLSEKCLYNAKLLLKAVSLRPTNIHLLLPAPSRVHTTEHQCNTNAWQLLY